MVSVPSPLSCVLWQVLTTVLRQSDSEERVLGVLDRVLSMLQATPKPLPSPPPTWSASSSQTPPPAPNVRTASFSPVCVYLEPPVCWVSPCSPSPPFPLPSLS